MSFFRTTARLITLPLHAVTAIFHSIREQGLLSAPKKLAGITRTPVSPVPSKVMFVSSDNNPMSGAFLAELELNKALNTRHNTQTCIILPYDDAYGNSTVEERGLHYKIIPSTDWIVPMNEKRGPRFYLHHYRRHVHNTAAAIAIARMALKENYQLLHSNTTYVYVGSLAARMAGLPHVWHLREFPEEGQQKTFYHKKRAYSMIASSDRVITISKTMKKKYETIVPEDRLVHIYDGVDSAFYCPDKEIFTSDIPRFLFVGGGDSPYKGRKDLIKACSILKKQNIDFKLQFVGWCGQEIIDMINEAGIADRTEICGEQKDVKPYYRNADIMFVCSRFEGFGRTTAEAMLSGCLVIGTNTAGTGELVTDGKTGLSYTYENIDELVEKTRYALSHKEEMRALAAAGRKEIHDTISDQINAAQVHALYGDVLSHCKPRTVYHRFAGFFRICCRDVGCQLSLRIILPAIERIASLLR